MADRPDDPDDREPAAPQSSPWRAGRSGNPRRTGGSGRGKKPRASAGAGADAPATVRPEVIADLEAAAAPGPSALEQAIRPYLADIAWVRASHPRDWVVRAHRVLHAHGVIHCSPDHFRKVAGRLLREEGAGRATRPSRRTQAGPAQAAPAAPAVPAEAHQPDLFGPFTDEEGADLERRLTAREEAQANGQVGPAPAPDSGPITRGRPGPDRDPLSDLSIKDLLKRRHEWTP